MMKISKLKLRIYKKMIINKRILRKLLENKILILLINLEIYRK